MSQIETVECPPSDGAVSQPKRLPVQGSWSACQSNINPGPKKSVAEYFAEHDFLVSKGSSDQADSRERAAHFLVAPGTTPNIVTRISLEWMQRHWAPDPFTVTWYPLGALIPATLADFKKDNAECGSAARLFLCPGEVDPQSECITGDHPVEFLDKLDIRLTGSILSTHRFEMKTGKAYFYFSTEKAVQQAGATLYAENKYLFLDPSKFGSVSGSPVYDVSDLLDTSESVTIYTVTSDMDEQIQGDFKTLCESLEMQPFEEMHAGRHLMKRLRLCIVSSISEAVVDIQRFRLTESDA